MTRAPPQRTIADRVPLSEVMSSDLVCARPDLEIATVVSLMVRHHVGCVPVVDDRRHPIGMITKFDLIEHVDAAMQSAGNGSPMPTDLAARTADEVMMPIALVLDECATIAHATAMMSLEDTHHVLVVREGGELVGVVSSKDIVQWLAVNDGLAREQRHTAPPWHPLEG
jgi:CBS domain-containing protein